MMENKRYMAWLHAWLVLSREFEASFMNNEDVSKSSILEE